MNQLNDVSYMQMIFQIFKITIHLSNLSISNFFFSLEAFCVALFEKLEFNEKVLNLKLVVFLKAITEANIFCLSTLFHTFVKVYSFVTMQFFFLCTYFNAHHVIVIDKIITS